MTFKNYVKGRISNWKEEYLPPLALTVISSIIYIILIVTKPSFASPNQIFFYVAIIWIPALFYTLFSLRLPSSFKIAFYGFITCSNLLATVFNLYAFIPHFDTILHTTFEYLCGYIGIYVLLLKGDYDKMTMFTRVLFCFALVGLVGVLWECCEYAVDVLSNGNTQHNIETGVIDTMQDQFCNLGGALVFVTHYLVDLLFARMKFFTMIEKNLTRYLKRREYGNGKKQEESIG